MMLFDITILVLIRSGAGRITMVNRGILTLRMVDVWEHGSSDIVHAFRYALIYNESEVHYGKGGESGGLL